LQQRVTRQNLLQQFFALDQRMIAQILVVEIDEVERAVAQPYLLALGILQQLEARAAAWVKRDKLAVDDREAVKAAQGGANRGIFSRQVDQVPRIKRDRAILDFGHQAEAVPFRLEDPVRIVEGLAGQSGQHGTQIWLHGRVLPCQKRLAVKYISRRVGNGFCSCPRKHDGGHPGPSPGFAHPTPETGRET
jgi:hypothetical protein